METFKVGDCVKYAAANGSVGKVELVHYTPGESYMRDRYLVRWVYGRDNFDKPVTAQSNYVDDANLVSVSEAHFAAVEASKFNSGFKYHGN